MAFLRFFVLLLLPSMLRASNQACADTDVESEEVCALQKIKSVATPPEASYISKFPTEAITSAGYFKPTTARGQTVFGGKKVFISKNSCSTVLYCLQTAYAQTGLGPEAHGLCKSYNIDIVEGCSLWMQTFMNQLALTLGSSSLGLNLFLDFNSAAIRECLTPSYSQSCVDNALNSAVEEADVFIYFPGYYCGPSCITEVQKGKMLEKARRVPTFTVIEIPFKDYYKSFADLPKAVIPSAQDPPGESFIERQGGARAATFFLQEIQKALAKETVVPSGGFAPFVPDGACAIQGQRGCISGKEYTNTAGAECLVKTVFGSTADSCDLCKKVIDYLVKELGNTAEEELGFTSCEEIDVGSTLLCGAADAPDAETTFPVCEAIVIGACFAIEDAIKDGGDDFTSEEGITKICQDRFALCPSIEPTDKFCGCLPAGECVGNFETSYCCSGHSEYNLGDARHCLRNFHQGEFTPYQCVPR